MISSHLSARNHDAIKLRTIWYNMVQYDRLMFYYKTQFYIVLL